MVSGWKWNQRFYARICDWAAIARIDSPKTLQKTSATRGRISCLSLPQQPRGCQNGPQLFGQKLKQQTNTGKKSKSRNIMKYFKDLCDLKHGIFQQSLLKIKKWPHCKILNDFRCPKRQRRPDQLQKDEGRLPLLCPFSSVATNLCLHCSMSTDKPSRKSSKMIGTSLNLQPSLRLL